MFTARDGGAVFYFLLLLLGFQLEIAWYCVNKVQMTTLGMILGWLGSSLIPYFFFFGS